VRGVQGRVLTPSRRGGHPSPGRRGDRGDGGDGGPADPRLAPWSRVRGIPPRQVGADLFKDLLILDARRCCPGVAVRAQKWRLCVGMTSAIQHADLSGRQPATQDGMVRGEPEGVMTSPDAKLASLAESLLTVAPPPEQE
jgi:hypothetical protein